MTQRRYLLSEDAIPTRWYNVAADLPSLPPPPLHPGTGQPVGPGRPRPDLPDGADPAGGERRAVDPDPRPGARDLLDVAADAALPRARPGGGARHRLPHLLQVRGGQPGRAATSRTPRCRRPTTTSRRASSRLATETGAGQWGSALAFACRLFDIECKVYMVRASYDQKPYRRSMIRTWGAEVVPSPSPDTAAGRGDPGGDARQHRQPRHRDQRGGGGRGHARRHQVRARQRAEPRPAAPDDRRARRRSEQLAMAGAEPDVVDRLRRRRLQLRRAGVPVPAPRRPPAGTSASSPPSRPRAPR